MHSHWRRVVPVLLLGGALGFCHAPTARADTQPYYPSGSPVFQGHVMTGYSATSGATANYLQGGWIIDGGVTYWPRPDYHLGLRADASYSAHNATNQFIASGEAATNEEVDYGNGGFTALQLGPVYRTHLAGNSQIYGFAQGGFTRVHLELGQTYYVPGYYCDPFFGYCDGFYDVGESSVYDFSTTKFSWDVGLGVEFPSPWGNSWFVEAQYRRVESQQPMEYWPITVGLRF